MTDPSSGGGSGALEVEAVIVAGWLRVAAEDRASYLDGCRPIVEAARAAPGCIDFAITGDLLDPERINVFEHWESTEAVERFRGSGPDGDQQTAVLEARVSQHTVTGSELLT